MKIGQGVSKGMTIKLLFGIGCAALLVSACSEPAGYENRLQQGAAAPDSAADPPRELIAAREDPREFHEPAPVDAQAGPAPTPTASQHSHEHRAIDDPTPPEANRQMPVYPPAVVEVSGANGYVSFEPRQSLSYEQLDVVVTSRDGKQINKTFVAGEPIALDRVLEDGTYSWEYSARPYVAPEIRERMRAVRERGDPAAERQLIAELRSTGHLPTAEQAHANVQSGYFTIKDGVIVQPQPEQRRDAGDG